MSIVPMTVFPNPELLGRELAARILTALAQATSCDRPFLLGCPSGRSLKSTYVALGQLAAHAHADLSHLVIVMMDEYLVETAAGLAPCSAHTHFSCRRYAVEEIMGVCNAGLPPALQVRADHLWLPGVTDPSAYDRTIEAAGGIDVFLVAAGASDGHVAFNPPGTALASRTRIIKLHQTTRTDNLRTFPQFGNVNAVPRYGVSVGLATISLSARTVVMVLTGDDKRQAVTRIHNAAGYEPDWPATFLQHCRNAHLFIDRAAAGDAKTARAACVHPPAHDKTC